MRRTKVEFIESYIKIDDDDYKWNDNHGELIRCKNCKHWYLDADSGMACEYTNLSQPEDGYCNWAEKKGEK